MYDVCAQAHLCVRACVRAFNIMICIHVCVRVCVRTYILRAWYGMVCCGMVLCGRVSYGIVWMVRYGSYKRTYVGNALKDVFIHALSEFSSYVLVPGRVFYVLS